MSLIYIIVIALSVYYSIRWDGVEEDNAFKKHRYWMLCVLLILITGFSYGLGGDKFVYMRQFEAIPTDIPALEYASLAMVIQGNMPLWTLLTIFAKKCFDSFYAVQIIQAVITNLTFFYIASKYTHRNFCFIIVYFLTLTYFIFNTEIMREGIAIAICMAGMEAYMNGHKRNFYLCYILAILFHVSAAVVIVFPLLRLKITFKTLAFTILISLVFWTLSDIAMGKIVNSVLGGTGAFATKIIKYSTQANNLNGFIGNVLRFLILPFIVMYYSFLWEEDEDIKRKKQKLISFYLILAVCACSLAGFSRFRNYMEIYYLIMLSDFIFTLFRKKEHFLLRTGTLVATIFMLLWQLHFTYYPKNEVYFFQRYTPYRCIINENKDVWFREEVHKESVEQTVSDEGTRDIR